MKTLLVLKNIEKDFVVFLYSKNKDDALNLWSYWPRYLDWEIVYLEERKKTGHRYDLEYTKFDEDGELYSEYIICFSKKEALILEDKIREVNPNYMFNIKKLY